MTTTKRIINAAADGEKTVITEAGENVSLDANFTGLAYSGGTFRQWWSECPVVVDLAGLRLSPQVPLLYNHYNAPEYRIGANTVINTGRQLDVSGSVDGDNRLGKGIITGGKKQDWQLSIGTGQTERIEFIAAGNSVTVNGRNIAGPLNVVREVELREISVVAVGADNNTHMRIAAGFINNSQNDGGQMKKELQKFIIARYGLANDADAAAVRAHLESISRTEAQEEADRVAGNGITASATGAPAIPAPGSAAPSAPTAAPVTAAAGSPEFNSAVAQAVNAAMNTREQAEADRVNTINAAFGSDFPELRAQAITERWTLDRANKELVQAMRDNRPQAGTVGISARSNPDNLGEVIQAAALLAGGMNGEAVIKLTSEQTVDAAVKRYRSGISLKQIILEAAWANGCTERFITPGNWYDVTATACMRIAAGFSGVNLPGIFSNIAHKFLLDGFNYVDQSWREVAGVGTVTDFKEVTRYRLGADFKFQKISKGGEIKHGRLSETSFKNSAETRGVMIGITREDIINDDLGALTSIPNQFGIAAGQSFNEVFWTEFLDNDSFFSAANGNLITGNPLGIDGLSVGVKKFRLLRDENKQLIGAAPKLLLVGPSNDVLAGQLYNDTTVIADGVASAKSVTTNSNPHKGKYKPVCSPYLEDTNMPGASELAYYLLSDPRIRAAIEAVFLNGVQTPVVESSSAAFNTLGIEMRSYMDFGVRKQEPLAGMKIAGK